MQRFVLDTNVVVAGLRSPFGASATLLKAGRHRQVVLLANAAMVFEYEAVCSRPEHREAAGLSEEEVAIFLDVVSAIVEPVDIHFLWRPILSDPNDEMVLEAAVNGQADAIVTFNARDYGRVPKSFGIDVLTPAQAVKRLQA